MRVEGAGMRKKGDGGRGRETGVKTVLVLTTLGVGIPVLRPDTAHNVG